jgi:hypothetical protein
MHIQAGGMDVGFDQNQHELHLWIYYMSQLLNTSEFINMINYTNTNPNP